MIGISILSVILILVGITLIFVNTSPQFGGKPTKEQQLQYATTDHYEDGKFINQIPSEMEVGLKDFPSLIYKQFKRDPDRQPSTKFDVQRIDSMDIELKPDSITRLTWFGHSAFLLEIAGKKILLDPMFGDVPAPHPWLGKSRYSNGLPIEIEKLPKVDAIIMSHDHYDHLDYGSIMKLKEKTEQFDGIELEYDINGQKSAKRAVSVAGPSNSHGRPTNQLETMHEDKQTRIRSSDTTRKKVTITESNKECM